MRGAPGRAIGRAGGRGGPAARRVRRVRPRVRADRALGEPVAAGGGGRAAALRPPLHAAAGGVPERVSVRTAAILAGGGGARGDVDDLRDRNDGGPGLPEVHGVGAVVVEVADRLHVPQAGVSLRHGRHGHLPAHRRVPRLGPRSRVEGHQGDGEDLRAALWKAAVGLCMPCRTRVRTDHAEVSGNGLHVRRTRSQLPALAR